MKNKLKLLLLLLLFANVVFAQQSKSVATSPVSGTIPKTSVSQKASDGGVVSTSAEGKKGLNAVNVRNAKQAESSVKGQSTSPPAPVSSGDAGQDKHAINTKGTGATRDGASKVK